MCARRVDFDGLILQPYKPLIVLLWGSYTIILNPLMGSRRVLIQFDTEVVALSISEMSKFINAYAKFRGKKIPIPSPCQGAL